MFLRGRLTSDHVRSAPNDRRFRWQVRTNDAHALCRPPESEFLLPAQPDRRLTARRVDRVSPKLPDLLPTTTAPVKDAKRPILRLGQSAKPRALH